MAGNIKYPNLFKPIVIGGTLFKNRIISAPTGHPNIVPTGGFTDDAIAYYVRKAQGGAAAITLGEAIVDSVYGKRHMRQVSLDSDATRHSLSRMADSISRHGAVASIELQHSGMSATPGIVTPLLCTASDTIYGPSDCEIGGKPIKEMPEDIILEVIDKFAKAALFVKNCGFGMVTVHAGHGWLLNQFFAPRFNKRTDKWGGSVENRARFTIEVTDAIHRVCGAGFPVEVRISATECHDLGYGIEEGVEFAKLLEGHADIIHASVGFALGAKDRERVSMTTHPSMFLEDGANVKYAAEISKHIKNTAVATVGALTDPAMMEEIIASGKADIVEMARGLICDPDLPNKAMDGREEEIVTCMRCLACFSHLQLQGQFYCAFNPETSRERYLPQSLPKARKQKVLVIGGGIGGMQAALTAAESGHEVILCEKNSRLGGSILCEDNVPFKKYLKKYIQQRERMIANAGIDLRLNTEVTPERARSFNANVIIAAIGAEAVKPDIPGIDGPNVIAAATAYEKPGMVKDTAVILGGGLVGSELAIYLASLGKKACIVEMADSLNFSGNHLHGSAITAQVQIDSIDVHLKTKAKRIDEGGVWCDTPQGEQYIKGGSVVYAVGYKPLNNKAAAFYDCAEHFHPLGDCVLVQNIGEATAAAMTIASDIGRY